MALTAWKVASDVAARLADLRTFLDLNQEPFAELFGRGRKQVSNWETGKQEPPPAVLERAARVNRWPLEIFMEGGRMPREALQARRRAIPEGARKHGQMMVGERRYETPYGAPVREAIDKIIDKIEPEDIKHVAAMEVADAAINEVPMAPKRILWWIERAFEAGKRVASAEQSKPGTRQSTG